jgi:hypothetical protein
MSTRSRIGIENQDGTTTSIYCHFDGMIDGVGAVLQKHYTNRSKVEQLIALGSISYIAENVSPTGEHSFAQPEKGVVVAYHRDRGEPFDQQINQSVPNLFNCIYQSCEELTYCFTKDNIWLVSDLRVHRSPVVDLKVAIEEGL